MNEQQTVTFRYNVRLGRILWWWSCKRGKEASHL